jgi:hypothetical protein
MRYQQKPGYDRQRRLSTWLKLLSMCWIKELNLILKCLKLTINIIFQSHFIAHLMRSNARDHANPDSGLATTSQAISGPLFTADQMDDLHWFFR